VITFLVIVMTCLAIVLQRVFPADGLSSVLVNSATKKLPLSFGCHPLDGVTLGGPPSDATVFGWMPTLTNPMTIFLRWGYWRRYWRIPHRTWWMCLWRIIYN